MMIYNKTTNKFYKEKMVCLTLDLQMELHDVKS